MNEPVCLAHGKRDSEHEHGRCLYCCLCFEQLGPQDCWTDKNGETWDVCRPCGEAGL